MSVPKTPGPRNSISAMLVLGLSCLLSVSGYLHGQQPVQLGSPIDLGPETPPPPPPPNLPPVGESPAKTSPDTLPPPSIGVDPAPNSLPQLTDLPPCRSEESCR